MSPEPLPGPTAAANTAAARALVAGLAAAGVTDACVSPGSRSTPLTVAFAEQTAIKPWLHLDERSSAFFALGLARATRRPVAVLCTSGTAAANFWPAVAEANLSRVPLVLLTTDRPPSLRDVGAAQTIDQPRMYGSNVRLALDLPVPGGTAADAVRCHLVAGRAVRAAMGPLPGPVHLNIPFEEPLLAAPAAHPAPIHVAPGGPVPHARIAPQGDDIVAAARALAGAGRPVIVAGPETGGLPAVELVMLAEALGAPVLADVLSGLRTGDHEMDHVLAAFDAVLRAPALAPDLAADAVVHFGAAPTSKALNQYLAAARGVPYILCDLPGGFRDPNAAATHLVPGDPGFTAEALSAAVTRTADPAWLTAWQDADQTARRSLTESALAFEAPFEGRVFVELQDLLPGGSTVVAGNSMPVRDLDSFVTPSPKRLEFAANRGANGIDGVTSAAIGAAAAGAGPVVLVTGDLSFYHDMNGLWAATRHGLDVIVVVVNNNGGGIFHHLPQEAHTGVFEEWFGTPADLDFAHAAALYRMSYTLARSWEEFRGAVRLGLEGGAHIIEVRTDRRENLAMHRQAWAAAAEAVTP